jgi:hypothetical protein
MLYGHMTGYDKDSVGVASMAIQLEFPCSVRYPRADAKRSRGKFVELITPIANRAETAEG